MDIIGFLRRQKLTQQELGDAIGTSNQNVNRWVTGKGVPSYEFCKKLLEMGMRVDELFGIDYEYIQQTVSKPVSWDEFWKNFNVAMEEYKKSNETP